MTWLQALTLALIQGITEFLPVSSSAHLVLVPSLFGWQDQALLMDVAVHVGTLGAVVVYFRRDIMDITKEFLSSLAGRAFPKQAACIVIATLPAVILGALMKPLVEQFARSPLVIGVSCIVFGTLMYKADKIKPLQYTYQQITYKIAFLIGLAQACALIPGASRSGTTLTMARWLGLKRFDAFRFSFILSIPVVLGAAVLSGYDAYKSGLSLAIEPLLVSLIITFLVGYAVLIVMVYWVRRYSLAPFAFYRMLLGIGLLWWYFAKLL